MATISEALRIAIEHHEGGRLHAAEPIYRQILQVDPNQPDAWHLLGLIAHQVGRHEAAIEHIRRAIALKGSSADFHSNLGNAYHALRRGAEAIECYRWAIELKPDFAEAHGNLGLAYRDQGAPEEAVACCRRALALKPDFAEAHNSLGLALRDLGHLEESVICFRRALEIKPDYAQFHNALGVALANQGKVAEGIASLRRAIELRPGFAEAHQNLGIFLLLLGQYQEGWREHEHRLPFAKTPRHFSKPRWNGEPAAGRTIFIHAEQGFGDAIQFLRYVPLIRQRSGALCVYLETPPGLVRLLVQNGGWEAEIVASLNAPESALPPFDCQVPLLSLPLALAQYEPRPMAGPYLQADPEQRRLWRERLGPPRALRVGLAWAGSAEHKGDRLRSVAADLFLPILRMPGFEFHSLQIGPPSREGRELAAAGLVDLTPHVTDFADTAALLAELELVISVDTAVAHLAGAMGRPVWVLLQCQADWRWGVVGEKTPWYPSMRLFRQPSVGHWEAVVRKIAAELNRFANDE
jgi:tetratricopeptide (TPR) repeat protein